MSLIYAQSTINIKAGINLASIIKILSGIKLLNKDWVRRHRHAGFVLLSAFIIAQVLWWVIFQMRFSTGMQETQKNIWKQEIKTAEIWLTLHNHESQDDFIQQFTTQYPDLEFDLETRKIVVSNAALRELENRTTRVSRMFIGEGLFFTLIIILGIIYLSWSLQRELEIERSQANFLAATSHELKTPVTAIRLLMEPLASENFPPEQKKEVYTSMLESLDRLQILIDQLLMAKSTRAETDLENLETADLAFLSRKALETFYNQNNPLKKINLDNNIEEVKGVKITSEHWILVINNLLNNCIKYSGESVNISTKLYSNGKNVYFEISDNGFGFPITDRKKIFRRFYRYLAEQHQNIPGTGLGLYLSKELIKQYGGNITAESDGPGKGATFTVKLPAAME